MSSADSHGNPRDIVFAVPPRKSAMGAPTTIPSKDAKKSDPKQHKRSRSGCFTCRLRRKKCDETKGCCRACKHLGLKCEYKRPQWWGNSEQRRQHKDFIKDVIKRTQLAKKTAQNVSHSHTHSVGSATPPGLCHSISTPEGFSDPVLGSYTHSRTASIDQSPLVSDPNFHTLSPESYFSITSHHHVGPPPHYAMFSPYEVEYKTERQIFVNDIPTRRDSTISSFSAFPPPINTEPSLVTSTWNEYFSSAEALTDDSLDFEFFDLPVDPETPTLEILTEMDEADRPLLNHFVNCTSRVLFPVLDSVQGGTARSRLILPALDTNVSFRHHCLSVAGTHQKTVSSPQDQDLDTNIMRHRYTTIEELCSELSRDENHDQILETTLGLMYFTSCVGSAEDAMPDIPWHHHLPSAKALAENLRLPSMLSSGSTDGKFPMTLLSWIDILGATMRGKSPVFADLYRELNVAKQAIGLLEMMGGNDQLMYLISEIACLEERRLEGMDEVVLCRFIEYLGIQISAHESAAEQPCSSEEDSPPQRTMLQNLSVVFRIAARIYLCSMVPGFDTAAVSSTGLVQGLVDVMSMIPSGPGGFDRSLAWPLLIAGSASTQDSQFRTMFTDRYAMLDNQGDMGSIGRVKDILIELWAANDAFASSDSVTRLHWRDIMAAKGWDCLLL